MITAIASVLLLFVTAAAAMFYLCWREAEEEITDARNGYRTVLAEKVDQGKARRAEIAGLNQKINLLERDNAALEARIAGNKDFITDLQASINAHFGYPVTEMSCEEIEAEADQED